MEKIKIFYGPAGSGKSKKAEELTKGKKSLFLNGKNLYYRNYSKFFYQDMEPDTEFLIIDEVPVSDMKNLMYFMLDERIIVNKQSKSPFEMILPKTILIVQCDEFQMSSGNRWIDRFELIKFPEA